MNEFSTLWGAPYIGGLGQIAPVGGTAYKCYCGNAISLYLQQCNTSGYFSQEMGRASTHLITCITSGLDTKSALVNRVHLGIHWHFPPPPRNFDVIIASTSVYNTITSYWLNVVQLNLTFLVPKYVQNFIKTYKTSAPTCTCTLCMHLHFPCMKWASTKSKQVAHTKLWHKTRLLQQP